MEIRGTTTALSSRLWSAIKDFFECLLLSVLAAGPLPRHVAIIMDGNRRFAKRHNLQRNSGHVSGAESLSRTLRYLYILGVEYVSVYAFSVENFSRPKDEVEVLMDLLRRRLVHIAENGDIAGLAGVRVKIVGNLKLLPENVLEAANRAMEATARNDRAVLNICVAYSSSDEIANAVRRSCAMSGFCEEAIGVESIEENLFTAGCPDPDILIRTSGETRLSNFLLWQSGLCYLHVCRALWPEFSLWHLVIAILGYQRIAGTLQNIRRKYGMCLTK